MMPKPSNNSLSEGAGWRWKKIIRRGEGIPRRCPTLSSESQCGLVPCSCATQSSDESTVALFLRVSGPFWVIREQEVQSEKYESAHPSPGRGHDGLFSGRPLFRNSVPSPQGRPVLTDTGRSFGSWSKVWPSG